MCIVGNRVALIKTKHGTFSRTTDCVTPPFPLAPLPSQKPAVGDLTSDVTNTHDQSQPAPITSSTPTNQSTTSTGGGGAGRMITTSIDEGRSIRGLELLGVFVFFLFVYFFLQKFILSLKLILKKVFNLIFEKIRDSANFVNWQLILKFLSYHLFLKKKSIQSKMPHIFKYDLSSRSRHGEMGPVCDAGGENTRDQIV